MVGKRTPGREKLTHRGSNQEKKRIHLQRCPKPLFWDLSTGLSAFWALHNCKPGGKEQIAPALPASW